MFWRFCTVDDFSRDLLFWIIQNSNLPIFINNIIRPYLCWVYDFEKRYLKNLFSFSENMSLAMQYLHLAWPILIWLRFVYILFCRRRAPTSYYNLQFQLLKNKSTIFGRTQILQISNNGRTRVCRYNRLTFSLIILSK